MDTPDEKPSEEGASRRSGGGRPARSSRGRGKAQEGENGTGEGRRRDDAPPVAKDGTRRSPRQEGTRRSPRQGGTRRSPRQGGGDPSPRRKGGQAGRAEEDQRRRSSHPGVGAGGGRTVRPKLFDQERADEATTGGGNGRSRVRSDAGTAAASPAPPLAPSRRRRRRFPSVLTPSSVTSRGKTARRKVLRVEPRSVARLSCLFFAGLYTIFLVAALVVWIIALLTGAVHSLEHFVQSLFGYQSFHFAWLQMLLGAVLLGIVLVGLGTLLSLAGALLFNLISGLTGGVDLTVSE